MTPLVIALVALAGGIGSVLRYVLHTAGRSRPRSLDPAWRILAINVAASFVAGVALVALSPAWQPVAIAGLCGGLSTWSTFMTDTVRSFSERRPGRAIGLLVGHFGYGLLAAYAGLLVGRLFVGG